MLGSSARRGYGGMLQLYCKESRQGAALHPLKGLVL